MENNNKNRMKGAERLRVVLSLAVLVIALAAYAVWVFKGNEVTVAGSIAASLSLGLFALSLVLMIPAAIRFFKGEETQAVHAVGERSGRLSKLHPVISVILTVLLARVVLYILAYILGMLLADHQGSIFSTMQRIWLKMDTDAPHYISIAENGYTRVYPQMYTIVFPPLYPVLIHYCNYVFGNSFVSAMMINTVCSLGAAAVIYELALCDMGRRAAKTAVLFTFALPGAIFMAAPMSEALFILLCGASLLAMRKKKFWLAGLFGGLASCTRTLGVILIVPFAAEAIAYAVSRFREKGKERFAWTIVKLCACALMILLGTFFYLLINKLVWGDWFKFLEFQREIWYQRFGPFYGTVATQTNMLFKSFIETEDIIGLWLPNLLFIFGSLTVLIFSARTLRTSYSLYFAAYLFVACGATWLLSAPRYISALTVLPIALAHLCGSRDDGLALSRARAKTWIVAVTLIVSQIAYLVMYILKYSIY